MADDPYLAAGRKALSGEDDTSSLSPITADPYLAAGRKALSAAPAAKAVETPDDPYSIEHARIQIPLLHNFAAGLTRGVRNVEKTTTDIASWVDQRVPALRWLDQHTIGDPVPVANALNAEKQRFEASPEGQSTAGQIGTVVGEIAGTLPAAGPAAAAAGAGMNAVLRTVAPRAINWLARTAVEGAAGGATYGAMTERPIAENALIGAALGPPGSALAQGVGLAGRTAGGIVKHMTGRSAQEAVDTALAEAEARAAQGGGGGGTSSPVAQPATATPAPQSGGAAATPSGAIPTPDRSAEIAGKLRQLDMIISDRPNVNRSDFDEYVKGNRPTLPEGLGDANLAGIQRQVEADNPRYANFRERAKENRVEHFEQRSGIPEQLDELEKNIAKWDEETLGPVWANKKPVDASNVETYVRDRLDSPEAVMGPVEDALKDVEKRLYKRGTEDLHTDPQMLYGLRRHISWMLSRQGRQANPAYGTDDVMRELIGIRDQIDKAIEPGAAGFKQWVTEHAAKMREVDRMDVLQTMRQKLFAGGEITQGKLMAALKALRTSMNSSGAHPAHSLTNEDLEMLRDLNKDLLREGNKRLSMPVGSPTSRNDQILIEHGLNLLQDAAGNIPGGRTAAAETLGRIARRNAERQKQLFEQRFLNPPTNPLSP